MVKDRLAEFKEKAKEDSKAKDKKGDVEARGSKMNKFEENVKRIDENLNHLKAEVKEVRKMQNNLYCSPFVTQVDLQNMEHKSNQILSDSIKIRKDIELLSAESSPVMKEKSLINSGAHQRIQMSQIDRLSTELRDVMNELRAGQADYIDKTKARFQRQMQIVSNGTTNEAFEGDIQLDFQSQAVFTGGLIQETLKAKGELQDLYEREKEIHDLETQIHEVNKLFKEVHALVSEGGEKIDTIESNVIGSAAHVESGKKELKKAEDNKKKARKKKIIIIVIIVTIVIVFITIIAILVPKS